jgi:hypothetical protein
MSQWSTTYSSALFRKLSYRQLTTVTRSPSSIYQSNWVLGYHTHGTLGVWLEVQIRLFKPVCQLDSIPLGGYEAYLALF